jgi:hypothetical protein
MNNNIDLGSIPCIDTNINNVLNIELIHISNLLQNLLIKNCPINLIKIKFNLKELNDRFNIIKNNTTQINNFNEYIMVSIIILNIFLFIILIS